MALQIPTVIIPAYNERAVIGQLLSSIYDGAKNNNYQVVVACNGCSDNTYEYVKEQFPFINCINIVEGSKTNAINQAEKIATGYPRLYIDADVIITSQDINKLILKANSVNSPILCAPRASINTTKSHFIVKAYYRTWQKTKFYINHGFGSGIYVLNQPAREMFDIFPNIIADDGYVREFLNSNEIVVVEDAKSTVQAPVKLIDLIKIKSRSKLGNYQLSGIKINRVNNDNEKVNKTFVNSVNIFNKSIYYLINFIAMVLAKRKIKNILTYQWDRDESSRGAR